VDLVFPKGACHATDEAIPRFALPAPPAARLDGDAWVYWKDGARIKAL
jgi:hypothetical protein